MSPVAEEEPSSDDEEVWSLLAGSAAVAAEHDTSTVSGETTTAAVVADVPVEAEASRLTGAGSLSSTAAAVGNAQGPESGSVGAHSAAGPAAAAAANYSGCAQGSNCAHSSGSLRSGRVPVEILEDPALNDAIARELPASHNFEVHRTIWRLRRSGARHLGLQLPDGLQRWALALADILRSFSPAVESTTIFGDVTFGACCIDDLAAHALGIDLLVHYGHSCIVPTDQTTVATLYVHVEVKVDVAHLVETVRHNFSAEKRLAIMGSVQFTAGAAEAARELQEERAVVGGGAHVPQVKPLGLGETLGCTSPAVTDVDAVVFVCDGRFHLESAMIQNPHVRDGFFRYDPGTHTLTREGFAHNQMHTSRRAAIEAARSAELVGLILGTLGRQGSSGVLEEVERLLDKRGLPHLTVLLSEISPERLALFDGVGAWVQVACPRLSLDWGDAFGSPLLTPYEAHVAFGGVTYKDVYPMDYYSNKGGPWSNYGAHNGHGGSLGKKFSHLRGRKCASIEYEEVAV